MTERAIVERLHGLCLLADCLPAPGHLLFTDVLPIDAIEMRTITPLDNPDIFYVWWHLSRGLYTKLFDNLGFDVHFTLAEAVHNDDARGTTTA